MRKTKTCSGCAQPALKLAAERQRSVRGPKVDDICASKELNLRLFPCVAAVLHFSELFFFFFLARIVFICRHPLTAGPDWVETKDRIDFSSASCFACQGQDHYLTQMHAQRRERQRTRAQAEEASEYYSFRLLLCHREHGRDSPPNFQQLPQLLSNSTTTHTMIRTSNEMSSNRHFKFCARRAFTTSPSSSGDRTI